MSTAVLAESACLSPWDLDVPEEVEFGSKGIWRSRLIEADVQGSSGYYPAEVLRRDGAAAFPTGTHVYLDHPSLTEEMDRPERSVRDLAGFLIDDARYEEGPDGRGLFARIQFIPAVKDQIQSLAPHVGLSIRAAGEIEETSTGRVVRSIREGLSVDVVTRAGAGGRLINMTESAQTDSSTAGQGAGAGAGSGDSAIPSTIGTGTLVSEVSSLKEAINDRFDQLSVDLARNTQQLRESQLEVEKLTRANKVLSEAITYLKERQEGMDLKMKEAKSVGDVLAELIEAQLPMPSMIRIAQTYRPDQDLHESIKQEREYLKKVLRESERGALTRPETSNLGLTESAASTFTSSSDVSKEDLKDVEAVLSGSLY